MEIGGEKLLPVRRSFAMGSASCVLDTMHPVFLTPPLGSGQRTLALESAVRRANRTGTMAASDGTMARQ